MTWSKRSEMTPSSEPGKLSPTNWRMAVSIYAKTGQHCETCMLITRGKLPDELQAQCERERASYLKDRIAWEMRWDQRWL